MSPIKRTRHSVYDLKYHFVWIPKYRKKLLKGDVATFIGQAFRRIANEYGWEIEEMAIQPDHVHIFLHAPPKYAPARIVQIMKSISAREVFAQFPQLRQKLWAGEFWSDGYFVRSVG
ncbi:MAG: IS200/IS605 family transposase, partial [Anaerolineae bacterium]|nr:IS200/IS605 family transposase [Anaerolineae bacterium]